MKKIMIVFIFLLMGCGVLTKDKLLTKNQYNETLTEMHTEELLTTHILTITDSNNVNLAYTIWPKGAFKFSPHSGFEGEAFSLRVEESRASLRHLQEQSTLEKQVFGQLKKDSKSMNKMRQKEVIAKGLPFNLTLLGITLIVMILLCWYFKEKVVAKWGLMRGYIKP